MFGWRRRRRSTPSSTSTSSSTPTPTPTPSMIVYASGWYEPAGHRQYDTHRGNCHGRKNNKNGDTMMIRRHKGSRSSKRYHCVWTDTDSSGNFNASGKPNVSDTRDHIRYGGSNQPSGHHPCKGLGSSYMYQPGSSSFPGAHFGFKCTVSGSKIPGLISGNSGHINSAGATDSNNNRKTIKDQLLFGGTFREGGTGTGYCLQKENLAKKIGNKTCFELVSNRVNPATAENKAREYCTTSAGRKDEMCKCINVAGSGFLDRCRKNPTWAGCKEIIPAVKELEKLLAKSNIPERSFGNADCIVPDICSGNVYKPLSNTPACQIQMAVCNQVMKQDNVKAYGDLKSVQSCNIDFSSEQNRRDREKQEAARNAADAKRKREADAAAKRKRDADAAAKRKRDADAAAKRKRDAAAKKKRDAAAKKKKTPAPAPASKKAPATSRTPSGSPAPATASAAAPATGGGLAKPGGMPQQTQIGLAVGGVVVLISCLMFLMMMMRGGGGRRR